eukprot:359194-Chlamydomonas_euryale.AAC.15
MMQPRLRLHGRMCWQGPQRTPVQADNCRPKDSRRSSGLRRRHCVAPNNRSALKDAGQQQASACAFVLNEVQQVLFGHTIRRCGLVGAAAAAPSPTRTPAANNGQRRRGLPPRPVLVEGRRGRKVGFDGAAEGAQGQPFEPTTANEQPHLRLQREGLRFENEIVNGPGLGTASLATSGRQSLAGDVNDG